MDIFRTPKPAAGFYKSMCEPEEEIVLEPAFYWARGDESIGFTDAVISSNCEHLKLYIDHGQGFVLVGEGDPDRNHFPHLPHAPFSISLKSAVGKWGDLRIDGYIAGKVAVSKTYSGKGIDQKFEIVADDTTLVADGADTTRVVMRCTDEFGSIRQFATDAIVLTLEGPAELIGDNPFGLVGGTGAVWVRAKETAGTVRLHAKHPRLGVKTLVFRLTAGVPEVA
jgi:beta-galactosidase